MLQNLQTEKSKKIMTAIKVTGNKIFSTEILEDREITLYLLMRGEVSPRTPSANGFFSSAQAPNVWGVFLPPSSVTIGRQQQCATRWRPTTGEASKIFEKELLKKFSLKLSLKTFWYFEFIA